MIVSGIPQTDRPECVVVIRQHLETGHVTWFGNLTSAYGRSRHHGATQPPYLGDDGGYHPLPTYGDGEVIETEYLELALSIAEDLQVDVEWKEGDVVLLDVSVTTSFWVSLEEAWLTSHMTI